MINDAIILRSELDARLAPALGETQQIADPKERERRVSKLTAQILDEMVNEELIVQAAEAGHIEVESSEVQAALDEIKHQNNLDDAGLKQALAEQGYTLSNSYKQDLRRQLLRLRAVNQLVAPKVQVTEEDVRARYDQMQRRGERAEVQVGPAVAHAVQAVAARDRAADQRGQGQACRPRRWTASRPARSSPRSRRPMSPRTTVPRRPAASSAGSSVAASAKDWQPIVFSMQKGDLRGPVTGPQGLHVFTVTEIKTNALKPFADMKEQLQRDLKRHEMDKQTQTWVEELRKKAYIDIKLQ